MGLSSLFYMVDLGECFGIGIGEGCCCRCCSIGLMVKLLFLSSLSSVRPTDFPNLVQQTNKEWGAAFTFDQGKARVLGSPGFKFCFVGIKKWVRWKIEKKKMVKKCEYKRALDFSIYL